MASVQSALKIYIFQKKGKEEHQCWKTKLQGFKPVPYLCWDKNRENKQEKAIGVRFQKWKIASVEERIFLLN